MSLKDPGGETPHGEEAVTIPHNHIATRAADDSNQMLVYDVDEGDGAWIQGNSVDPTKVKR